VNHAFGKSFTSSRGPPDSLANLVNGIKDSTNQGAPRAMFNYFYVGDGVENPPVVIELDFGAVYDINQIVITGRQNADGTNFQVNGRNDGSFLELLDASKNVVMTFPQMLGGSTTLVYTFAV